METAYRYIDALREIDKAERYAEKHQWSVYALLKLDRAHDAAEAAWKAVTPELRVKLSPPPDREPPGGGNGLSK